jgi:hypothetical protein
MATALHPNVRGFFAILWILVFQFAGTALGAPVPLKELEFMVRQKQPEGEIIVEVTRRKLAEKPSEAFIDKLILSGASPSLISRLRASELVAPPVNRPAQATPAPAIESQGPPQLPPPRFPMPNVLSNPKPRAGTVAAALDGKTYLERENELAEFSLSVGGEPRTYLLFFTRAEDKPSRKFISVVRDRLNQWMIDANPRPLEICRARDRTTLVRHAIGRRALWPLARYEELDPRLQALCPKPETRIALITQDWEVLVSEVAPPADLAMSKVKAVLNDRFKIQLR